jgi:hypothetical protein
LKSDINVDSRVAIKVINKAKMLSSPQGVESMLNEIRVHWALEDCPSVLGLIAIHEDSEMIFLVLEY